ncbi:hypothetical protein [Cellulophaga sp. L1A9]|uniref:hypothetical protein n=1 Tax=Cellulophaga sp. L1A9 TaxID=2686362 RepID=UPI00131AA680|nr:hypothetical protein [Cellulophaga sp. L1A9]
MKKLISIEERESKLIEFGAPKKFIQSIGNIPEIKFRVENVDAAYFYFPKITNYKILSGLNIIPIYDEGNSFRVFGYNDSIQKIFHFELENDEIYTDYETNWELLLFDIMFQYYEDDIDEILNIETFKKVGNKLGFDKSEPLYKLLDISLNEYNQKYREIKVWKKEIIEKLEIQ